jgi:hypothetical protein
MDIKTILSLFSILQRKSTWVIVLVVIGGYFIFEKYESRIVEKFPQAKKIKQKIDTAKKIVS